MRPTSGPSVSSNGTSSLPNTVTERPRRVRLAAVSMPMKLAPMMTALLPSSATSLMRRQSARLRSVKTFSRSPPSMGSRRGTPPVASSSASASSVEPSANSSLLDPTSAATTAAPVRTSMPYSS